MSPHRSRRRIWFASLALCALGAGLLTPLAAQSAVAVDKPDAAYAAFDTVPVQNSGLSSTAKIAPVDVSSTEYRYSRGIMQTVVDSTTGVVALQSVNADGSLDTSTDLSALLDEISGSVLFNNWSAKSVLTAVVWGSKDGAPVLVKVASPETRTLAGATVSAMTTALVDPARLEALAEAGSGLMTVHRESDGGYVAQRLNYELDTTIGSEIVLDLPAASERRFALDSSYGNIISSREGAVDVVSRYSPDTVHTVEVADLGLAASIDIADSKLAVADTDGDVGIFELKYSAAHALVNTAHIEGGVSQLAFSTALDEVLIVASDRGSIERLSAKKDGTALEPIDLAGGEVLSGSLESSSFASGGVLLVDIGGAVYRYATTLNRAAAVFVYQGKQIANISGVSSRANAPKWSFAAMGTGQMEGGWEYSLDGGEHWASRGAAWDTAVPDIGDERKEATALPAPLEGVAPATRTEVSVATLHSASTFARTENAVSIPSVGFDAVWRVRVSNAFASVASTPQRIAVADSPQTDAPALTRHPASHAVAQSESVALHAEATGTPAPTVQWQISRDKGATWSALANQTSTTLTLTGHLHEDGALYRAVFTNSAGTATTEAARVTVTGPAAQPLGAAPEGAVTATGASLAYDLSVYAHDWLRATWGENVTLAEPQGFTFGSGSGWVDAESGAAQIQWNGAAVYQPYGGMNGLHVTIADPYLAVGADGRGSITAAVAWNNGGGMGGSGKTSESAGFMRVVIATFAASTLTVDGESASFSGTPEWQGRTYVKPGLGDATTYPSSFPASFLDWMDDGLRPWFYASGSSLDSKKAPSTVTASFTVTTDAASTDGEAIDPVEPIDVAPTVTQRPLSVTVTAGDTVTLTAKAGGRPSPAIRWQVETADGWTDVAGATQQTLVVEGAGEGSHRYRAVFTNRAGEVATSAARVTVEPKPEPTPEPTVEPTPEPTVEPTPEPTVEPTPEPTVEPTPEPTVEPTPEPTDAPAITAQPVSVLAPITPLTGAAEVSFAVEVSGTPAPTVVWQKSSGTDWVQVGEGMQLTYAYIAADAGTQFRAVVTNSAGTETSLPATLSLGEPATASIPSPSVDVTQGDELTLTATVTGTDAVVGWQALFAGASTWTAVDGADQATLVVAATAVRNGTQYRATVHSPVPTHVGGAASEATSEATTVTLSAPPVVLEAATDADLDAAAALTATNSGRVFTIEVGTAHAGQYVDTWVHSAPNHLGWQLVDASGRITVTVPSDLDAGAHRIAVLDSSGSVIGVVAFSVAADRTVTALASTGGAVPTGLLIAGALALLAGLGALGATRLRRRAVRES